jgi:hypothetical protein
MAAKKSLSQKDQNGQKIVNLGTPSAASSDASTAQYVDDAKAFAQSLDNATGTISIGQLTTRIPGFDTQVRSSRLDQMTAPTASVPWGSQKITGLADPTLAQDAATKAYVDAATAALSGGLAFKGAVRVATATNVTLATPGATIDSVAPTSGDVVLLTGQSTGAQNGPYVWTGAASALTRPANWDTTTEAVPGSMWIVQQGTFDNQLAIMSNDTFTLGSTTATFVFLNPASAADNDTGYTATCPAVSAGATWTVNHGLGSKAVIVQVYRTASPFDEVDVDVERSDTANVLIKPDVAISSGEYTVVVSKVI